MKSNVGTAYGKLVLVWLFPAINCPCSMCFTTYNIFHLLLESFGCRKQNVHFSLTLNRKIFQHSFLSLWARQNGNLHKVIAKI